MRSLLLFCLLLLPAARVCSGQLPAAAATRPTHFAARITDATGALIPGAHVTLVADGVRLAQTSGPDGAFTLDLAPGLYTATVSCPGFETVTQPVTIPAAESHALTFLLRVAQGQETIEVRADDFRAAVADTATKMPLSLQETPQQLTVLTSEVLRSRAVETLKQALELVPAVGLQLGEGRRDNFYLRGFNAVSDMYVDGVRDDAQYYRDLSSTERLEVLEGPAAVLYGRGSSGGLINRVTRKPSLEGTMAELSYTAGSYGEQRGAADLDTLVPATNGKLGFRLTGAAEQEGSQRHFFWMSRYAFTPSLRWQPSAATSVFAQLDRLRDDRLPDRGIPYLPSTGLPAPVATGNFYGYVGPQAGSNFIHSAVTGGTLDERHAFASGWNLHATQRLAGYSTNFVNMYASSVVPVAGTSNSFLVYRGEYNGRQRWTTTFANLEASRSGHAFGLNHTLLLGFEYAREVTPATQYTGPSSQTPVDLWNPANLAPQLSTTLNRNNRFFGQTLAVYAQDLVQLAPRWKMLAGVRFDNFRQALDLYPPTDTTANLARTDNDFSPRVGLVYTPRPWSSYYVNYSHTFDPSGENLSLAANNSQLGPEATANYEAGAKLNLLRDRLSASASVFRLDRTNIKVTDPNNPTGLVNAGEQRTDGAEASLQGAITRRWQLTGGYAWLDARIVSSTTLSSGILLQGKRPAMTPLHAGSLWSTYSLPAGFGVGVGLVARALQFASTDNLAHLPAYARVDASVFYRRARWDIQANLQNLANQRIWDAAQSDFQIYPAAPLSGQLTARYRF